MLYGLIPAAGKGVRVYPYAKMTPKGMLDINGTCSLLRNIKIMRDDLGIRHIFIVIGYLGEVIKDYFGDGKSFGVEITYLENEDLERGWAYSILLGRQHINDYFCVILSDECYINSNHRGLLAFNYQDALATCGVMRVEDKELIKQNYAVKIDGDRIIQLTEKPGNVINNILGCGTFIFNPRIFGFLEEAFIQSDTKHVDLITFLNKLCLSGEHILHFTLQGMYVNINDGDSLNTARQYDHDNR